MRALVFIRLQEEEKKEEIIIIQRTTVKQTHPLAFAICKSGEQGREEEHENRTDLVGGVHLAS